MVLATTPARVVLPAGASGPVVPRLAGVAARVGEASGVERQARLALALLEARVAPASLWTGEPQAFIRDALARWVERHGAPEIDRRFELHAFLDSRVDRHYAADGDEGGVFLCVEPVTAGFVAVRAALAKLSRVDPRLPATVYRQLRDLTSAARIYDQADVEELQDQEGYDFDGDDLAEYRKDHPLLEVPAFLRRPPLGPRALAARAPGWPPAARRVVEACAALRRALRAFTPLWRGVARTGSWERVRDLLGDMAMPLPILLLTFDDDDTIAAYFDDEMQHAYSGETPEPAFVWPIDELTPDAVREAFARLAGFLGVLRAATALIDLLVGREKYVFETARGRTLADVLLGGNPMHEDASTARVTLATGGGMR